MLAEIISIGDELTSGQRLDTNSQWLSERLGELGVPVVYHTTVADDLAANLDVFRTAARRADLVISTGGLGPTADDLTREVLAGLVEAPLELRPEVLARIEAMFAHRQRAMPERNRVQALFPHASRVVHNPHGTAPGISLDVARPARVACRVIALPGVPAELKEMWDDSVRAEVAALSGTQEVICHRRVKCFGVGESDLEQMLPDLIRRGRDPSVGITVSEATITLRVSARGASPAHCETLMAPTLQIIHDCLGDLVYGSEDDELQHAVARLLAERQLSLVTVESASAGLLAGWFSEVAGEQFGWHGGWVLPATGVPPAAELPPADWLPSGCSAGNLPPVGESGAAGGWVRAAAETARRQARADLALVVAPLTPSSESPAAPPVAWYGLASAVRILVHSTPYVGHPAILQARLAKQALNLLRLDLLRAGTWK